MDYYAEGFNAFCAGVDYMEGIRNLSIGNTRRDKERKEFELGYEDARKLEKETRPNG